MDDPVWKEEFHRYSGKIDNSVNEVSVARFRDYGFLKYWFRGVAKFAPWVRKVHFVTSGQKPDWLDETHPKLNLVSHEDYIPQNTYPFSTLTWLKSICIKFQIFRNNLCILMMIFSSPITSPPIDFSNVVYQKTLQLTEKTPASLSSKKCWKTTFDSSTNTSIKKKFLKEMPGSGITLPTAKEGD